MSKKRRYRAQQKRDGFADVPVEKPKVGYVLGTDFENLCVSEYTSLDHCPEVMTGVRRIAELIGSMTIYLMSNTKNGDVRISNELSRKIDIEPMFNMTRSTWMQSIIMNLFLYGKGNSVVWPHTRNGYLTNLEPLSASRVSFVAVNNSYMKYKILVDGKQKDPDDLMHFVLNPDRYYMWMGRGVHVSLRDLCRNLRQANATERGFLESKWKPSIIVKVDAMVDEFSTPEGRAKILNDYVTSAEAGQPWLIPGEQFQVEQVKPLTLADLAIKDTVELDKKAVAAILGVPAFLLGVGAYNQKEWNNFIQNTVRPLALSISQEMTRKLILNPNWYLKFNTLSLMDWDVTTISQVFGTLYDRGIVTGNEVRDRIGLDPKEDLDKLLVLENFIPLDKAADQLKLAQGSKEGE